MTTRNLYGDDLSLVNDGQGVDVASQRLDDLDHAALQVISALANAGRKPAVADYGCGRGGFARAARRLTTLVDAVDQGDFTEEFAGQGINFRRADLGRDLAGRAGAYQVILCQRTIHYLRYPVAVDVCRKFRKALSPGGLLFMSASGLHSELSHGYPHADRGPGARFCNLAPGMQKKHGITHPVCLYLEIELRELVEQAGMTVRRVWTSPFGNIKLIAEAEQ